MAASPMANSAGSSNESSVDSSTTAECLCPPVARRARLDGVDLAALAARAQCLRFPTPAPDTVVGAKVDAPLDCGAPDGSAA